MHWTNCTLAIALQFSPVRTREPHIFYFLLTTNPVRCWRHFRRTEEQAEHSSASMLLTTPDCFSTGLRIQRPTPLFSTASASSFNSLSRTRTSRVCKASLITNSDSFEVGRLIGSYGFMNVTRYRSFTLGFLILISVWLERKWEEKKKKLLLLVWWESGMETESEMDHLFLSWVYTY